MIENDKGYGANLTSTSIFEYLHKEVSHSRVGKSHNVFGWLDISSSAVLVQAKLFSLMALPPLRVFKNIATAPTIRPKKISFEKSPVPRVSGDELGLPPVCSAIVSMVVCVLATPSSSPSADTTTLSSQQDELKLF